MNLIKTQFVNLLREAVQAQLLRDRASAALLAARSASSRHDHYRAYEELISVAKAVEIASGGQTKLSQRLRDTATTSLLNSK